MPILMHIDMNSYFATVAQQDYPDLRGKPVGICEHLGGIIIAASVEAKKLGITTGTPVWEAKNIYPQIALLPTHAERYRQITRAFVRIFQDYTDDVSVFSIDEACLDITHLCEIKKYCAGIWTKADPYTEAQYLAKEIKARIKLEVGDYLTCSIGIAHNKLLAKIASDMQKPDGLVVIRPQDIPQTIARLELTDIPGIGNKQARKLALLGIHSLLELSVYPESNLIARFGIMGYHLARYGRLEGGLFDSFKPSGQLKSMGHMYTLPKAWRVPGRLLPLLQRLCDMVGKRMRIKRLMASSVMVIVHTLDDNNIIGHLQNLPYFSTGHELFTHAQLVLQQRLGGNIRSVSIKFLGVTAARLMPEQNQESLFPQLNRQRRIAKAIDIIETKHGSGAIGFAGSFKVSGAFRDTVGFGRVKEL